MSKRVFVSRILQEQRFSEKVGTIQEIHPLFIQVGSCCLWQREEGHTHTSSGDFWFFSGLLGEEIWESDQETFVCQSLWEIR